MTQIPTALIEGLTSTGKWRILNSFWSLALALHSYKGVSTSDPGDRAPDFHTGGEEIARC
jgi:hypothetical protein